MPRDPRHDVLFEPIDIGPKTMRNRFYQSPHCTSFGTDFPGAQAHIRSVKAEGGWAAVNTEFCSVHPSSDSAPMVSARLWDEGDMARLAPTAELAHEHGALAGVELWHGGSLVTNAESRMPARGVTQGVDQTMFTTNCYGLDQAGIREIQRYYVEAARRAAQAGFDIVNVHGAEGASILSHFLMAKFNRRTDEYGGSLENRARIWLETLEQVREAVGDECAIAARLCIDTLNDSPLGIRAAEEGAGFIALADHLVDFWDLQVGGWSGAEWTADDPVPSRLAGEYSHRELYVAAGAATAKPIAAVGRFTNPDTMADAVASGEIQIIAAARPSIADPFLPRKIEEGRYEEIRECIGCNICASRFNQNAPIICTQNATLGEEYRRGWHPERFVEAANADRDVLVIGAGPAGMECAMVLGKRGMRRVHLVEAEAEIGGCMRAIRRYPNLGEWGRLVDYRTIQLDRLDNVEVITSTRLSAEEALTYGAEIVVVATGSRWRADGMNGPTQAPIPGADGEHVYTPEAVAAAPSEVHGERVVIYDTDGYFTAAAMAETMLEQARKVTVVTPFPTFGPTMFATGEAFSVNRELLAAGVEILVNHVVTEIAPGVVRGAHTFAPGSLEWEGDSVILVTQRDPPDGLYHELRADPKRLEQEGIEAVYRVGDCVAPRLIADCVFDGHRLAREIDSEEPATPLPYLREVAPPPGEVAVR